VNLMASASSLAVKWMEIRKMPGTHRKDGPN
jgi:hypothetical protein